MTYIQPNHAKKVLNLILAGLAIASVVGVFSLIALYNNIVDLNHSISSAKTELDSVGAKNTTLNNQIVGALHSIQSNSMAAERGLIENNHPQYVSFNQSWPIASQR
jgi:cell division protein FtsB